MEDTERLVQALHNIVDAHDRRLAQEEEERKKEEERATRRKQLFQYYYGAAPTTLHIPKDSALRNIGKRRKDDEK